MPTNSKTSLKTIVDFARRKGFVYPSSEIYGGFAATYDFGPLGHLLKQNLVQAWRNWMVNYRTDTVEIDGAIFMHPRIWEASGHVGGFADLLVEDLVTKKRYRADHLVEEAKVIWPVKATNPATVLNLKEEDLELPRRRYVRAVIFDPLSGKYLFSYFAKVEGANKYGLIGGGIDIDEDETQALEREILEETGYNDYRIIGHLGGAILSPHDPEFDKEPLVKENTAYLVILNSQNRVQTNLSDNENKNGFKVEWKNPSEVQFSGFYSQYQIFLDRVIVQLSEQRLGELDELQVGIIEKQARQSGRELIVDCFIINNSGQILTQKRSATRRLYSNCWDLPGGHVDEGDSVWNTIFKEVKEELNLEVDRVVQLFDQVEWSIPDKTVRNGENVDKLILQFIVTVKTMEGLTLEEGKADEFRWIDSSNLEILKENRSDEGYGFYIHDSVKKVLESLNNIKPARPQNPILTDAGSLTAEEIDQIIEYYNLKSPDGNPLSKARKFNMLVKTHLGPIEDDSSLTYLKGESCANIYVDWKAVQETTRRKLPFGIAQLGKAFRNEITVKQFMFRTREFEQIDMEFFVKPAEFVNRENGEMDHYQWFEYWKNERYRFYTEFLNYNSENLKWHQHSPEELVFYAAEAWDIYYSFGDTGFKEMEGVHNRTDYDTRQHQQFSGSDLTYQDPVTNQKYLPYIVEMSLGVNRLFLSTLFEFYNEEVITKESKDDQNTSKEVETRVVFKLPMHLAPYKIAILPLMKKDGLAARAEEIYISLRKAGISCDYDEAGSIGKRYRRQDENGTPYCVCVDYQTLENGTVTVRDRDTMEQRRVTIEDLTRLTVQN